MADREDHPRQYVVHFVGGLDVGGAERTLIGLVKHLERSGRCVDKVVTVRRPGLLSRELAELGVPVVRLASGAGLRTLASVARNRAICQGWMVHGNLLASVFSALSRRRAVWTVHATTASPPYVSRSTWALTRASLAGARLTSPIIVSCSVAARDFHIASLCYPKRRFDVIPAHFSVDEFRFDPTARADKRAELGVDDQIVFGSVGRFGDQKDYPNVIRAFARVKSELPDARLLLIGRQLDRSNTSLMDVIDEVGLRPEDVDLMGERTDIAQWFPAMDVFVLGSQAGESFPMVVGEAMACERIPVVTEVGDSSVMVGDAGMVVPPRSASALASAMISAAEQVRDRPDRRWGPARAQVLERFDEQTLTARWLTLYGLESTTQATEGADAPTVH